MKTIKKNYLEDKKSKEWMDKNLSPTRQSDFIRKAVAEKITKTKNEK